MASKAIGSLYAELAIRDKKFTKGLSKAQKRTTSFGKMATKAFAFAVPAATLAGIAAIGKQSVSAASDLEESLSKSSVIFGKNAREIEMWANSASTSMGMAKKEAIESAATLGNLFLSMGQGQKAASSMSQEMIQLAADLGSFNNVSTDEAITAIGSGLRGEAEPLRRFGVLLNDAVLKAKALEMGLYNGKGALGVQAKALAAYEVILEQTTTAQGDFARTSDGLANSQKILKARIEDAKTEIGAGLLPVIQDLTNGLNDINWEDQGRSIAALTKDLIGATKAFAGFAGEVVDFMPTSSLISKFISDRATASILKDAPDMDFSQMMGESSANVNIKPIIAPIDEAEVTKAMDSLQSAIESYDLNMISKTSLENQVNEIKKRESELKDLFNFAVKLNFEGQTARELVDFMGGAGNAEEKQALAELLKLEQKRLDLVEKIKEEKLASSVTDDMESVDEEKEKRDTPSASREVNDFQKRGLFLKGGLMPQKEDKKITLLSEIRDVLKAARQNGQLVWS